MDVSGWDMIKQTVSGDLGRSHIMTTIISHELSMTMSWFIHLLIHLLSTVLDTNRKMIFLWEWATYIKRRK